MVECRILGPLDLVVDGKPVPVGPAKQRALLGLLLLHANEVVSTERLVDELWGERPPATASKLVQVYVSQLRRTLEGAGASGMVQTRPHGYVAVVAPEQLDSVRFARLVAEARARVEEDANEDAVARYDEALALWRGPLLADAELEAPVLPAASELEELRLAALAERVDCRLALGQHARVIGELESLSARHPLHERFRAQLMVALYRAGRQSDALGVYHATRRLLLDELGLEPGPELRRLEQAILVQQPTLELEPPRLSFRSPRKPTRRLHRRRRIALAAAAATAAAAAAAAALLLPSGGRAPPQLTRLAPDSVAVVDPRTNAVVRLIRLRTRPSAVAAGAGWLWVGARDDRTLLQIEPHSGRVTKTIGLGAEPTGIALADGYAWVLSAPARVVFEIDVGTGTLVRKLVLTGPVRVGAVKGTQLPEPVYITAGGGAAWLAHGPGLVSRIDERTGKVEQIAANSQGGVAYGEGALWALGGLPLNIDPELRHAGEVLRIDAHTRRITAAIAPPDLGVREGRLPFGIAAGAGAVWVLNELARTIWKINPELERVTVVLPLRHRPIDFTVGEGAVWSANSDGTVTRIDPATGTVDRTIPLGRYPRLAYPVGIAAGEHAVWIILH